ncbi:hypothetical protein DPMN_142759 [Dreissena polymorpha]|uniref:Uncharacterized protein n=1 Tax=Dreissena polymorpha TaxID=45954 RepID=A0A9D4JJF9_DREPO|nr:hypothetical protein DPMN_142759 [Dreissena polymorpha]
MTYNTWRSGRMKKQEGQREIQTGPPSLSAINRRKNPEVRENLSNLFFSGLIRSAHVVAKTHLTFI